MRHLHHALNRRTLIKGLGVAGLISAARVEQLLAATTTAAPMRVLFVCLQHGWGISGTSNRFMSGNETDFVFPDGLDPFNSIREQCTVIDGLLTLGLWGNTHDLSYADMLTAGVPFGEQGSDFDSHMPLSTFPSLDYLLERKSGKPSYRFSAGFRSWGVAHHPVSFDDKGAVLPFYLYANDAYNSLFSNLTDTDFSMVGVSETNEAVMMREVFNFLREPTNVQMATLSTGQKEKLERYLLAVNNLQTKVESVASYSGSERLQNIPVGRQTHLDNIDNYLEMIKVGFANDFTRSAVLGIGDINDIEQFHHEHAHAIDDVWWGTRRGFAQTIVNFANTLSSVQDFDGRSLLDNTLIVLTGEVGAGTHDVLKKGHILIGGGARYQTGRYIVPELVLGYSNIRALRREDINGTLQQQISYGDHHSQTVSARTNADLLRQIGNLAGLNLQEFGFSSQNKGDVI